MRRASAGSEGIRGGLRDYIELGHRQTAFGRQPLHNGVETRRLLTRNRTGSTRSESDLVREKVSHTVNEHGKNQSKSHSLASGKRFATEYQD